MNDTISVLDDRVQRVIDANQAELARIQAAARRELTETVEQLATDRETIKVTKERVKQTAGRLGP